MSQGKIRVSCEGAGLLSLDEMVPIQGKLKVISPENLAKLKKQILTLGFSSPFHIWQSDENYILDGTQRLAALTSLRVDGWEVPELPVVYIEAKDKKEAGQKLLSIVSQYGDVSPDGLKEFIDNFDMNVNELLSDLKLPDIDVGKFMDAYFPEGKEVSFTAKPGSKELDEDGFQDFEHTCPKCRFEWND